MDMTSTHNLSCMFKKITEPLKLSILLNRPWRLHQTTHQKDTPKLKTLQVSLPQVIKWSYPNRYNQHHCFHMHPNFFFDTLQVFCQRSVFTTPPVPNTTSAYCIASSIVPSIVPCIVTNMVHSRVPSMVRSMVPSSVPIMVTSMVPCMQYSMQPSMVPSMVHSMVQKVLPCRVPVVSSTQALLVFLKKVNLQRLQSFGVFELAVHCHFINDVMDMWVECTGFSEILPIGF